MSTNYYLNGHQSQYQPGASAFTHRNGCTWTTGVNGADASTGGDKVIAPDKLHSKVKRSEESNPKTAGWSMDDLDLALSRVGVGFQVMVGHPWGDVVAARHDGLYIALQGDSDQFPNGTCSGAFDGAHCVGISPFTFKDGRWRKDDPICQSAASESPIYLRRYAEKLARQHGIYPGLFWGAFTTPVPVIGIPSPEEDNMGPVAIPQYPSIAEANRPTKLWTDVNPDTGALSGKSYDIPSGHTKRLVFTLDHGILCIGNDRDSAVPGKSGLYGKATDWNVAVVP